MLYNLHVEEPPCHYKDSYLFTENIYSSEKHYDENDWQSFSWELHKLNDESLNASFDQWFDDIVITSKLSKESRKSNKQFKIINRLLEFKSPEPTLHNTYNIFSILNGVELTTEEIEYNKLCDDLISEVLCDDKRDSDLAMYKMYSNTAKYIRGNKLNVVDNILKKFDVNDSSVELSLALLAVTRPAKTSLLNRVNFTTRLITKLKKMKKDYKQLIAGIV